MFQEVSQSNACGMEPEKFKNVTNGIDHRRWLAEINPGLDKLICDLTGSNDYLRHPGVALPLLDKFADDKEVLLRLEQIKQANKAAFAKYAKKTQGFLINPDAIFDVQVKRLHEYKRQLRHGHTVVLQEEDLQLILAQGIAVDLAGQGVDELDDPLGHRVARRGLGAEEEGVGPNLHVGVIPRANVEMHEVLGDENMFLFGLKTEEVKEMRDMGYNPFNIYTRDPNLHRVLDQIIGHVPDGVGVVRNGPVRGKDAGPGDVVQAHLVPLGAVRVGLHHPPLSGAVGGEVRQEHIGHGPDGLAVRQDGPPGQLDRHAGRSLGEAGAGRGRSVGRSKKRSMPVMPMTGLAVGAEAAHKEDALQVLSVMLSDEALQIYSETNRVISPSKNVKVDCVPALKPLNDRIEEGVYVLGSNAGMKVEQWGNTCLIVRELLAGASVDECMAAFDRLQDETLAK